MQLKSLTARESAGGEVTGAGPAPTLHLSPRIWSTPRPLATLRHLTLEQLRPRTIMRAGGNGPGIMRASKAGGLEGKTGVVGH